MRAIALALVAVAAAACAEPAASDAPASTTTARAGGSAAPSVVVATVAAPKTLARKTSPRDRRLADERACDAGELAACRKAADRYRGYGHVAGCGVDRDRPRPSRAVTASDAPSDARLFDRWIRRACDLGDAEACLEGRNNVVSRRITEHDVDTCARGRAEDCALLLWQDGRRPEHADALRKKRLDYLASGVTAGIFGDLYRRDKADDPSALPGDVLELGLKVCAATLECDDVVMMLDKSGYDAAAVAPLKKRAGEALVGACLAGDCVCGEAASYLDDADPRRVDLARIGCDAGEPDACEIVARGLESTDVHAALALYAVACPAVVADDEREEIYSKRACDRLSELAEEGKVVDQDSPRAFFYSTLACTRGGFERDHAPCLRRGLYHARKFLGRLRWSTMTHKQVARSFFYGYDGATGDVDECARPSVAAACKRDADIIEKAE
jgi:TPR repeat protein